MLPSGLEVATPFFMTVATKMSVKTLDPEDLRRTGTKVVITNGFLSSLEPGSDVIHDLGGMHEMMKWDGGIFSDSGGFQFIRKGFDANVKDEGVALRSPYTGEKVFLSPESVVDMHVKHGVDVGMVLDHCPPFPSSQEELSLSANRTVYWAMRSKLRLEQDEIEGSLPRGRKKPLLFAITQGGTDISIREKCTARLAEMDFPGYGIGGLSIGESKEDTFKSLKASTSMLPEDRPRYFMGVGDPEDVLRSIRSGVDIFDSVFPTRNARHRNLFTDEGRENVRASKWKGNQGPIMDSCECHVCRTFSRAYIYHLFKAEEPLGPRLATIHNIHYMQDLVKRIRKLIEEDDLECLDTSRDIMS